jgi:hypothetical protein
MDAADITTLAFFDCTWSYKGSSCIPSPSSAMCINPAHQFFALLGDVFATMTGAIFDPENPRRHLKREGSGVADDEYLRFKDSKSDGHMAQWAYLRLTATVKRR